MGFEYKSNEETFTLNDLTVLWELCDRIELVGGDMLVIHFIDGDSQYQAGWTEQEFLQLQDLMTADSEMYATGYELKSDGIIETTEMELDGVTMECTIYNTGLVIFEDGTSIYVEEYDRRK